MTQQSTNNLLMIRPVAFGFNVQTAKSNAFQKQDADQQAVQQKAQQEFDGFVNVLRANGVNVTVVNDTTEPHTPDSIFPNNWVSFHDNGDIFLYPMQAENRRLERREDIIRQLEENFKANHVIDLSRYEAQEQFLEGTGSMVLDRQNKITYACISPRTNTEVLKAFCEYTGYQTITFDAFDQNGRAIYHTNVLMAIGSKFAVICLDSIMDAGEKETVIASLKSTNKEIIDITFDQMNLFAGNMLEVKNADGETLVVMSQTAYNSLSAEQKTTLEKYGKLVYADISTIETNGGGSARCMMAEVHLGVREKESFF
ncbi:arginine deiminase-related protein [Mucilaginibacter sp. RB4R14]|uniref:citrulline utilization hydrolase CtlX n=1 Tax=Mucilaginibacter aurantiaciroseus TaxID=2949308 RepID=UPI0020907A68|nr:arginine deiminase-related protein [Mucilaginibacter aurantiaciroseus]MCO5935182.1 arginine deiminase-related protein [Mucilaginibacter aurantiaciroseus]